MADLKCARCGRDGGSKTELRHVSGKVTQRILDQPCRDRYNSDAYPAIVKAIDLDPIVAEEEGPEDDPAGECDQCGKAYADLARHYDRTGHAPHPDVAVAFKVYRLASEEDGDTFTIERAVVEAECDHEENCGFIHYRYADDKAAVDGAPTFLEVTD